MLVSLLWRTLYSGAAGVVLAAVGMLLLQLLFCCCSTVLADNASTATVDASTVGATTVGAAAVALLRLQMLLTERWQLVKWLLLELLSCYCWQSCCCSYNHLLKNFLVPNTVGSQKVLCVYYWGVNTLWWWIHREFENPYYSIFTTRKLKLPGVFIILYFGEPFYIYLIACHEPLENELSLKWIGVNMIRYEVK